MTQVSAHFTRNNFSEVMDMSQREPVEISKHGRAVSVLISKKDYDMYTKIMDEWWMAEARTDEPAIDSEEQWEKLKRSFEDAKAGRGVKRDLLT